jgi:MarR family transcriptional regulator, transcriptional regulator for hemolysin
MDRLSSRDRHDFAQAISIVARRWRTRLDERLKPLDMSIARWGALYWLGQAGDGVSQAALAELAGVEPPTLVRVIDQLEAQGLVERRASPTDRRVNLLRLTPAAKPLVAEIEAEAERLRIELLEGLSYEEYQTALGVMEKLRDKLG